MVFIDISYTVVPQLPKMLLGKYMYQIMNYWFPYEYATKVYIIQKKKYAATTFTQIKWLFGLNLIICTVQMHNWSLSNILPEKKLVPVFFSIGPIGPTDFKAINVEPPASDIYSLSSNFEKQCWHILIWFCEIQEENCPQKVKIFTLQSRDFCQNSSWFLFVLLSTFAITSLSAWAVFGYTAYWYPPL